MSNPVSSSTNSTCIPARRHPTSSLAYGGADGLALGETGGLQIATPLGTLEDSVPLSYQDIDGVRVPVASRYVLDDHANANGRFSFEIGAYRRDHELIIDPGMQYTTFLGGNSAETAVGIAVDSAGNAYVAGTTQSPNFPTTTGAFDRTGAAQNFADVFVTKLNPAGTALVYSTFVGGSDMEFGQRHGDRRDPATPTSPARRSRRTSRPPAARSTGPSTSRGTARVAGSTTPTTSSSSSTPPARR